MNKKNIAIIAVIVLSVIILVAGIIITIYSRFAKAWFDRGDNSLVQTVEALNSDDLNNGLDSSELTSYNETTITGDRLRAAIQTFITQDAVLVIDSTGGVFNYQTLVDFGEIQTVIGDSEYMTEDPTFYNIGILATNDKDEGGPFLTFKDDKIYTGNGDLPLTKTKNDSLMPLQSKKFNGVLNANYIDSKSSYYCKIIYDPVTTNACGVLFSKVISDDTTEEVTEELLDGTTESTEELVTEESIVEEPTVEEESPDAKFPEFDNKSLTATQVLQGIESLINRGAVVIVDSAGEFAYNEILSEPDDIALANSEAGLVTGSNWLYNVGRLARTDTDTDPFIFLGDDYKLYTGNEQEPMTTQVNADISSLANDNIDGIPNKNYIDPSSNYYSGIIYDKYSNESCGVIFSKI